MKQFICNLTFFYRFFRALDNSVFKSVVKSVFAQTGARVPMDKNRLF